jgi:hypothetical protein
MLPPDPPDPDAPCTEVAIPVPDIGPWRAGNTAVEGVWSFAAPLPGPHLLVTAIIHGNEIAGAAVLAEWLAAGMRPARGRLTLAFGNLAAFDRFDPSDPTASRFVEEDLNRSWSPTLLAGPRRSVELDRARVLLPVVLEADVLFDLHSMLWPSDPLLLAGRGTAVALARAIGTPPVTILDEGHAAGFRLIDHPHFHGTTAQDPRAVLLEAGPHWQPETAPQMRASLANLCGLLGFMPAGAPPEPGRIARVTRTVTAQTNAFAFLRSFRGGEVIPRRNTLIALDGESELRTPHDDCLLVMPSPRALRGHTAVRLARFEA